MPPVQPTHSYSGATAHTKNLQRRFARALSLRTGFIQALLAPAAGGAEETRISDVVRMSCVRFITLLTFGLDAHALPAHIRFRWSDLMGGGVPDESDGALAPRDGGAATAEPALGSALAVPRTLVTAMWSLVTDRKRAAMPSSGGWTTAHALQLGRPLLRAEAAQYVLCAALCQPAAFAALTPSLELAPRDANVASLGACCALALAVLDLAIESPATHTDAAVSSLRTLRVGLDGVERGERVARNAALQRSLVGAVRALMARTTPQRGAATVFLRGWQRRVLTEALALLCATVSPATPLSASALDILWQLWDRCSDGKQLTRQLRCVLLRLCGGGAVHAPVRAYLSRFLGAVEHTTSGSYERTAACAAMATSRVLVALARADRADGGGGDDAARALECLRVWGFALALLSDEESAVRSATAMQVSVALERDHGSAMPTAHCPPRLVGLVFRHLEPRFAETPSTWLQWLLGVCLGDRHLASRVAKALPSTSSAGDGCSAIRAGARVTDHAYSAQLRHWHPERIARAAAAAAAAALDDGAKAALAARVSAELDAALSAAVDGAPDVGIAALKATVFGGPHDMHARTCAVLRRLRILHSAVV